MDKDLISLLNKEDRPDLQILTLNNILALSGSTDGLRLISQQELTNKILTLLENNNLVIKKLAALILVNITAYESNLKILPNTLVQYVADPDSDIADPICMILSNITRSPEYLNETINLHDVEIILNIFFQDHFNKKGHNLYYLGPVLSNLSQNTDARKYILSYMQKLVCFTEFKESVIKRKGVVGTIRNCCFDVEHHERLLSIEVDVLPRLLLPLAGNEEFDDEDNDKLPPDLQYLPDNKVRESEPDIRCMLLEAILQLCTLRKNREFIRSQNAYVILRELHKWETDRKVLLVCENLVNLLIRTEEEIGKDNLKDSAVPDDLVEKFEQMDRDFLQN